MNGDLVAAIVRYQPTDSVWEPSWERLLLVRNRILARSESLGGSRGQDRPDEVRPGFDLLLLDSRGRRTHYCKFRHSGCESLLHESDVIEMLRCDPAVRDFVPELKAGPHGSWMVQISKFLDGPTLRDLLQNWSLRKRERAIVEVLEISHGLSETSARLSSKFPRHDIDLASEATESAKLLMRLTDKADGIRKMCAMLDHVPAVPSRPQHGDLWPQNIIWCNGSWRVLDFELFGHSMVPLYDVFHLLRTSYELAPNANLWVNQLMCDSDEGDSSRRIIRAFTDRLGLSPTQGVGAFVYYTLHHAVITHQVLHHPEARSRIMGQLEALGTLIDTNRLKHVLYGVRDAA